MSDNESFISIESDNDQIKNRKKKPNLNLDSFLDYDIDYTNDDEKHNYVGADILQRPDYFDIKNEKIRFFDNDNLSDVHFALNSRKKEEVDIFFKIKKELYNIAYINYNNKLNSANNNHVSDNIKIANDNVQIESNNSKKKNKNKNPYDLLNNDLGATLGNKIEGTYNDIKNSVNWLGNFFSNNDHNDEKKYINIFYSDLYFFNDITIIRFLDTYNYNKLKTLNKIIKFILWRQVNIMHFNKQRALDNANQPIKSGTGNNNSNNENSNSKDNKNTHIDGNTHTENNIFINPLYIRNGILNIPIFRCGYDLNSRPMLYIKIKEKLDIKEEELFFMLVYHVDMCINSIDYKKCYKKSNSLDNHEKINFDESSLQLVIVVDCLKFDLNNMISVDCIKKIINIFNEFYTDVLYRIYIINVPSFFKKVWSLFNMFIDNRTLKKITFINKKNMKLMYDHIIPSIMIHFDRTIQKNDEECIFFPSNSLYYKYDKKYSEKLSNNVNSWVDQMIKVNH